MIGALTHLLTGPPVRPDREQAQDWATRELSQARYQAARPGLIERALTWFGERLDAIDLGSGAPPWPALLTLMTLIVAVLAYATYRAGGLRRTATRRLVDVLPQTGTTAAQHRAAADRHAAAQAWDLAVVERFRAIARELKEGGWVDPQPGRTAREMAWAGGAAVPELEADLLTAADAFDDVWYGHRDADAPQDLALRALDTRLRAGRAASAR